MVSDENSEAGNPDDLSDLGGREEISALLTVKQREYLRGESEIEEKSAQERSVRSRIRKRLIQTISDLSLLQTTLEPRDVEKAFDTFDLFNWVSDALALIFDGLARASTRPSGTNADDEETIEMFEHFVEGSMERLYISRGVEVDNVEVTIDITFGRNIEEIADRDLVDIPFDDLTLLLESGKIGHKEYLSAVQQRDDVKLVGESQSQSVVRPDQDDERE
jgi:hypothetical protein